MRLRTLILLGLLGTGAFAQLPDTAVATPATAPGPNPLVTLASEFFEHDYVNVYAYGDGVLDTNNPIVTNTGQVRNSLGTGFDIGGGVTLSHGFKNAQLSLSYQGAYRDYQSSYYSSGTTQSFGLGYTKRLTRHLSINVGASGGIFLYGGTFFTGELGNIAPVVTSPFSPETRYLGASVGMTYQQTRRLSYSVYGSYFLTRYNYAGAIGSAGAAGGASVNYRLTARDTVSVVYSHSYFSFQRNAGQSYADQIGASYSHAFSNHWYVSLFGGAARNVANGTVEVPVTLLVGGQAIGGYVLGTYNQTTFLPSFSGSVSHSFRRSVFSASAGEGIAGSGNGYYLASRDIYANGVYSYSLHGQNISFGGTVYRLTSVANTVSSAYDSAVFSANYGRQLFRHVGMFVRYDYTHYGALRPYSGVSDNRISFGMSFSTRNIPLTLF